MANVEHSALTGSNLHEPKGITAATAGTIYIADGLGSGSWTTAGLSSLGSTAKAFEAQMLHVRDQVSSGTSGLALTAATWNVRTLQTTVVNEISGASLSSNIITLPAGTYRAEAHATWYNNTFGEKAKLRLRATVAGTSVLIGQSYNLTYSGSGITINQNTPMSLYGSFVLAAPENIQLQHWVLNGSNKAGQACSSGEVEVYADVMFWKIA